MNDQRCMSNRGFTLVEMLVAVLILTISVGALLSLTAGGFYSVRYARNQIVANNLLQESLEYVRNSRDTYMENHPKQYDINGVPIPSTAWTDWKENTLSVDQNGGPNGTTNGCLGSRGCTVDPYDTAVSIKECPVASCPPITYFDPQQFYGYVNGAYVFTPSTTYATSFVRKITAVPVSADQLVVTATIQWKNGTNTKTVSQSTILTNWRQ